MVVIGKSKENDRNGTAYVTVSINGDMLYVGNKRINFEIPIEDVKKVLNSPQKKEGGL